MEHKQVLERDRSFPLSQALSTSMQSGGVRKTKAKVLHRSETCPVQGAGRAGIGTLTKLGRLGGASVPVKPCQHPHFPQSSAETRLVVLGAAAKHLPASHRDDIIWNPLFPPLRRAPGVEEQGWRSRGLSRAL